MDDKTQVTDSEFETMEAAEKLYASILDGVLNGDELLRYIPQAATPAERMGLAVSMATGISQTTALLRIARRLETLT